jgi:tetratricopeptide (TPR) repeat protein
VASTLANILQKTREDIEWWMEKYGREKRNARKEKKKLELECLVDITKIAYVDFVHLSILLSQMFFSLEFSCRLLCSLACYRFSLKVLRSEVIQHKEVWKQVKRLGQNKGDDCEACAVRDSCRFEINFQALANAYAYAMKVRQIADYTTRLASLNIFKSGLFNPPLTYFSYLTKVVESNFLLAKRCLPDKYLPHVAARFLFFADKRKELYSPFSWDEAELKQLTGKQPKDALAWYLLGRLYLKRNDVFQAIDCLEKAKRANPKNPETWHLLGVAYDMSARTLSDERKALKHLEKARELNPKSVEILLEVSIIQMGLGNYPRAVQYLETAREFDTSPQSFCAINQTLYEAYFRLENSRKASRCLELARKIDSNFQSKMKEWLGEFLKERRKFRKHLKD